MGILVYLCTAIAYHIKDISIMNKSPINTNNIDIERAFAMKNDKNKTASKNTDNIIIYSNSEIPDEFMNTKLTTGTLYKEFPLAERDKTDNKTNCAIPSDSAVEDVRDWSIEKKV